MQNNRLMLIVALVAGVMATVLAFTYIRTARAALEDEEPEQTVEVLFVVTDLAANHVIDSEGDLRVGRVGVETAPGLARGAVKASERNAVHGLRINAPLPAGVPLLYSNLTTIQDIELAPGSRAMAITVDSANMMGGILVPGDRVDIIVSYRREKEMEVPDFDPQNPQASMGAMMGQVLGQSSTVPSDWEAEEVLSDIRVIAVGQLLTASRQAQMFGMSGLGGGGSTVTLEVTSQQARELIKATAGGSNPLTLLLRPTDSAAETGTSTLTEG